MVRAFATGTAYQVEVMSAFFSGFDKQAFEFVATLLRELAEKAPNGTL
jgi:hypothetical protein